MTHRKTDPSGNAIKLRKWTEKQEEKQGNRKRCPVFFLYKNANAKVQKFQEKA